MGRTLWLALGGTSVLTVGVLWVPAPRDVVAATEVHDWRSSVATMPTTAASAAAYPAWPSRLQTVSLDPAKRNFFEPFEVKVAKPLSKAIALPPTPAPPPPAAPPPSPPAMPYKVVGVMVDPEGQRIVVLGKPDKTVVAAPGLRLDEGYVVESVTATMVHLIYPALESRVNLPVPQAPQ